MTPYYEDDSCTIYHGDCRDVLPRVSFDAIVTDPPYGIDYDPSSAKFGATTGLAKVRGDDKNFDPSFLLAFDVPTVLFGATAFASRLPDRVAWIVWDKVLQNNLNLRISEVECAWTSFLKRGRAYRHLWSGAYRTDERHSFWHPTQKPVALMRWVLSLLPTDGVVVDPFLGSGPTLRAAKDLSRRAIGIEIEERYCEIAARRLGQEVLAL